MTAVEFIENKVEKSGANGDGTVEFTRLVDFHFGDFSLGYLLFVLSS